MDSLITPPEGIMTWMYDEEMVFSNVPKAEWGYDDEAKEEQEAKLNEEYGREFDRAMIDEVLDEYYGSLGQDAGIETEVQPRPPSFVDSTPSGVLPGNAVAGDVIEETEPTDVDAEHAAPQVLAETAAIQPDISDAEDWNSGNDEVDIEDSPAYLALWRKLHNMDAVNQTTADQGNAGPEIASQVHASVPEVHSPEGSGPGFDEYLGDDTPRSLVGTAIPDPLAWRVLAWLHYLSPNTEFEPLDSGSIDDELPEQAESLNEETALGPTSEDLDEEFPQNFQAIHFSAIRAPRNRPIQIIDFHDFERLALSHIELATDFLQRTADHDPVNEEWNFDEVFDNEQLQYCRLECPSDGEPISHSESEPHDSKSNDGKPGKGTKADNNKDSSEEAVPGGDADADDLETTQPEPSSEKEADPGDSNASEV
ncbi:MAG: hypothetical protein M1819_001379 [Sarea resinae]|nr:MAG: hypothetical protein M1819_001379 [Sarea resinae]